LDGIMSLPAERIGTSSPLPLVDETLLATTRYLEGLTQLDDEVLRQPSVLPGWTRGHVVAHLSRNADAFTQVLGQAACGDVAFMYASADARNADIEETVTGSEPAALLEDAGRACSRLADALVACQADPATPYTRVPGGEDGWRLDSVGRRRMAEVEIHHADLDTGYRPTGWPADFALAMVKQRQDEMAVDPGGCPSMVLSSTDVDGLWKFGQGQGPEIHGSAGDLAYWLVGRGGGRGLTSSSGDLPHLDGWR
jgi:maleylpyruvate isomerase